MQRAVPRGQRGVTLLELLIGMGVIIVVMVMVLVGMRSLNAQIDRSALLRQLPQTKLIIAGMGNADRTDLEGLTTAAAVKMGAFPRDMVREGDKVFHQFDGQIFTTGLTKDIPPLQKGRAFAISYAAIPRAECASLVRGLAMLAEGVWVDTKAEAPSGEMTTPDKMLKTPGSAAPIDVASLVAQCNPTGADTVTIHALIGP
jgi:hypothetical protein